LREHKSLPDYWAEAAIDVTAWSCPDEFDGAIVLLAVAAGRSALGDDTARRNVYPSGL